MVRKVLLIVVLSMMVFSFGCKKSEPTVPTTPPETPTTPSAPNMPE